MLAIYDILSMLPFGTHQPGGVITLQEGTKEMEQKTVLLNWLERYDIRCALIAEVEKLRELLASAHEMNSDEKSIRAIETRINDHMKLIEKMRSVD